MKQTEEVHCKVSWYEAKPKPEQPKQLWLSLKFSTSSTIQANGKVDDKHSRNAAENQISHGIDQQESRQFITKPITEMQICSM